MNAHAVEAPVPVDMPASALVDWQAFHMDRSSI